jgi:hypothetical protein
MALIVQGPTPAALRSAGPGRRIERWTGPVPPVRAFVLPVIVDEVMGQPRSPVRRSVITGGARRRRVASQDVPSIPLPSHFRRREKIEATARSSPMTGALRPGQDRRAASFHKWHAYRPLLCAFPQDSHCLSVADLMPLGNPVASRCHRQLRDEMALACRRVSSLVPLRFVGRVCERRREHNERRCGSEKNFHDGLLDQWIDSIRTGGKAGLFRRAKHKSVKAVMSAVTKRLQPTNAVGSRFFSYPVRSSALLSAPQVVQPVFNKFRGGAMKSRNCSHCSSLDSFDIYSRSTPLGNFEIGSIRRRDRDRLS